MSDFMKLYKLGDHLKIHKYKHDGQIHRCWNEATYLGENEDYMIFANYKTLVTEADGRTWKTKEPAIMYFSKHDWFNIIGQIKPSGVYYYCNIASPFVIEDDVIKYIDYDLDLRVFPDGSFKILDRGEYQYHKKKMKYSSDLDMILKHELTKLIDKCRAKEYPFSLESINHYYELYKVVDRSKINI